MPKFRNIPSSSSKKNLHAPLFGPQTLLPTDQIIDLARNAGVDFGPGDPAERMRYFIKLGILPHAVRKIADKTSNFKLQTSNLPAAPVGHLPYSSTKKLIDVDRLYKKGHSYPQIAQKLTSEEETKTEQEEARQSPPKAKPIEDAKPRIIYVQKIGNKDISEKLNEHEEKVQKIVQDELTSSLSLGKFEPDVENSSLEAKLIPAENIIKRAKELGVSFGSGNPRERIRHLIKLGILPHMVRKIPDRTSNFELRISTRNSLNASTSNLPATPVGHLPDWSIQRLVYVDKLHQNGLTFEQITRRIQKLEHARFVRTKAKQATHTPSLISKPSEGDKPSINFFPKIGVSENYIDKKLEEYQANFHKILEYKLAQAPLSLGSTPIDFEPKSKFWPYFKGLAITTSLTILVSIGIISGKNYLSPDQTKQIQENQNVSSNLIGEVLAATSDTHRLYIDADTQVSGTTLFAENITAPNVLYGAVAGTGITVSTGQTPTIGVDSSAVVTSVNDLAGTLTITGSGSTSISASGSTITISSTDNNAGGDITAVSAGNGLTGGGTSGDVSLAIALSASGTSSTTSSASGLQFSSGLSLLRGCSNSQTLAWISATSTWDCTAGGGSMTSFTLSGDTGTDQTIADSNTLEVAGGTNGIDTAAGATDTITINFDATEVGTTTWGSGSSIAWTFNAGATDPVLTFDSNALTLASAATVTATSVTAFNCTDCLDFDDLEDTLDIDATTTINTTATTTTPLSYLADSLTTGTGLLLSADALTTGTALDVSSTSTAGGASGTSYLLNLARSGANSNTAHTAYGLSSSVTNTNATSGTNIAGYFTATGATTANYALYIPDQTDATGPNYGLYVAGADDYSIYSAADDIYIDLGSSTSDIIDINATTHTGSAGVLDIDITSNTNGNRGIDLAYTFGAGLNARGYGVYSAYTTASTNINYNYGIYQRLTHDVGGAKFNYGIYSDMDLSTTEATNSYAGYFNVNSDAAAASNTFSLYGANVHSGAISSGTKNVYGIYANGDADSTASGGTSNAYGGYFVGDGDTDGTGTAYGIYATASNADTNYALYTASGNVNHILAASEKVYIDATTATNTGTAGVVDIDITSTTNNNRGFDLNYTWGNATASTNGYGILETVNRSQQGTTGLNFNNLNGQYLDFNDTTTDAALNYGYVVDLDMTGDAVGTFRTGWGFYADVNNANTTDTGTRLTYGGQFIATGSTNGDSTVYGLALAALSADTGFGLHVDAGTSTNNYGVYVVDQTGGTNDYGVYIAGADTAMLFFGEAPASASTAGLCWDNAGASAVTDCSSAPTDLAEYFGAEDNEIDAGDIVVPNGEAYEALGPRDGSFATKANIAKSTLAYQNNILGVVSTSPNIVFGDDELFSEEENPKPISLAGRVPVKVSLENSPIKVGDYITSSSTAGVGMKATKAGRVIGMALGSFDCAQDSAEIIDHSLELGDSQDSTNYELPTQNSICQGQIVVFVNPTFYLGTNLASNGSLNSQLSTSEVENSYTSEVSLAGDQIDESGVFIESQNYDGQILTAAQIRMLVEDEVGRQLALYSSQVAGSSSQVEGQSETTSEVENTSTSEVSTPEATDSAGLAQQTQQTLDELDSLLTTTHLSLDTLSVIGNTNLASTQIAGTFSQDGTLIIDYGKQINVLGSTLYLQNDPLAGCSAFSDPVSKNSNETGSSCANGILVNIGASKVTIDNQGNLVTSGKLTASSVQTKKLIVYTDEGSAQTVGTSAISSGSSNQRILTAALEPKAKILITPRTPTGGRTIYISGSVDFEGFTVSLENGPATGEIKFDWLIVNTASNTSEVENPYTSEVD